jgi:CRP-like cAMP-binding protein
MEARLKIFTDRFTNLTSSEIQELASIFVPLNVKKKDHLFIEGEVLRKMYFVNEGILRAYFLKDGVDYTTNFVFGPSMFSDMISVRTQKPTMMNVQLLNESEVFETNFSNIEELALQNPRILFLFFKLYEMLFFLGTERQQSFIFDSPTERYLKLFELRPKVIAEIPQQYIASYLGIKPETLSRIKKKIF